MLSVHLESGRVEVRRQPVPRVPQGFARIRLLAAGICSTDLELQRGYYGFSGTPGHEFVGEVVESGERVAGEINLACGHCDWCARGLERHCPTACTVSRHCETSGRFPRIPYAADSITCMAFPTPSPSKPPPSSSSLLAAACEILDQVKIPKGAHVALLGDGKLGLLIAQVLQAHGARVHLFGRHREKMRLVEKAGVTTELMPKKLPARAYRWVVDATGSAEGLRAAVTMCEPRGTIILKSTVHGLVTIDTAPAIVNEITLVGSRCGRFEPAIRLLGSGKVNVADLISDEFPLDRAPEAFARAATKGVLKVLLRPPR